MISGRIYEGARRRTLKEILRGIHCPQRNFLKILYVLLQNFSRDVLDISQEIPSKTSYEILMKFPQKLFHGFLPKYLLEFGP